MKADETGSEHPTEPLVESRMGHDPIEQFQEWFAQALAARDDANSVTLATSTPDGKPSARIVLLKGVDERGFVFFTNYGSRKGRELAANPFAALVCYWAEFDRQVRIEGKVEKVTAAESDEYHRTRPRGSQLGAWTSSQSEVISGREALEARLRELEAKFAGGEVPRPPYWGGYRLMPEVIEFWQNRPNRLHDRIRYRRVGTKWAMERLAP